MVSAGSRSIGSWFGKTPRAKSRMDPRTLSQDVPKPRRRWVRWLFVAAMGGLAGLLALLPALPWIIEVPAMQRLLASLASRVLAPGAVRFEHLSVFWNRPTEIDGLVLRDAQGDDIVVSPQGHFSWSLRQIVLTRPASATLTLDHAAVDIERSASGSVDLLETLKPILKAEPQLTQLVRVVDGRLRFRIEGLEEPFLADTANIELDLNAYPQPIAWRMKLERAGKNSEPGCVQIQGRMSRGKESDGLPEDQEFVIKENHWPCFFLRPPQDINVNPTAPPVRPLNRCIGNSPPQNAAMQVDIVAARAQDATDFRVNQEQVNAAGQRVGTNRPDLQYTDANGRRVYVEYDTTSSTRGPGHLTRIMANDPNGTVILRTVN